MIGPALHPNGTYYTVFDDETGEVVSNIFKAGDPRKERKKCVKKACHKWGTKQVMEIRHGLCYRHHILAAKNTK